MKRVFLSSTAKDLGRHRDAVYKAVSGMDGYVCVRMEDFGARDFAADDFCRARVKECDVFVGLIGHLYGSSPEGTETSFTEREYDAAVEANVPRLLFVAAEDFALPANLLETQKRRQRQLSFRKRVLKGRIVASFKEPDALAAGVAQALLNLKTGKTRPAKKPNPGKKKTVSLVDPVALRSSYLNRLMDQVGALSLEGIDPAAATGEAAARLSLDAVYTALLTRSSEESVESRGGAEPGDRQLLSALEQLNRHRRLVLLGDPGGGKSTFVNFVALCLAGEALGHARANLEVLRAPLPDQEPKKAKPQPWDHGPLLPVRVVLRDFAARGLPSPKEEATGRHLWDFIEKALDECKLEGYAPHLEKELQEKGGLLLFDGLDEVPEAESRRERIRQAVEDFVRTFGRCRVLVTCRSYAYRGQGWTLKGFAEAELAPFSRNQIRRFVERWYDHVAATGRIGPEEARGRSQLLQQAIFGSDRLRGLAERPLLLTLMASLHSWRGGSLPEKREQLYADAVELLLNRWESQRVSRDAQGTVILQQPSLGQYLDAGKDEVRQVIEGLAFEVHSQGDLEGTADVPQGELVARLMKLRRSPDANPAELVDYLSQRAGLLVPRGVGVYSFPHRTFQEYLAACWLTGDDFPGKVAELARRDPGRWREVALLAGAKAARGAKAIAWMLADHLCPHELAGREDSLEDAWGAHLAGQVLAESADLAAVAEANLPKLERIRSWHLRLIRTSLFPAPERALAGRTLAKLGDPRFDPDRWYLPKEPLLGFVEVPAGKFVMGEATDAHEVELEPYRIARYPVTVAQWRAFVESEGYDAEPASLQGLPNEPARYVSWHDALAYCSWLEARLKELGDSRFAGVVTLPSEAQWERAARGTDGRIYPWGDKLDPERANYGESGVGSVSAVGCFPGGASLVGCEEMSGNVWEWTRSLWGQGVPKPTFGYPYVANDGREDLGATSKVLRVCRGGAFYDLPRVVRCAYRFRNGPAYRDGYLGFRVALFPFSSGL